MQSSSRHLDFRHAKEKEGCRQHIKKRYTHCPHKAKFPLVETIYACQYNMIRSNYAINNFQTEF